MDLLASDRGWTQPNRPAARGTPGRRTHRQRGAIARRMVAAAVPVATAEAAPTRSFAAGAGAAGVAVAVTAAEEALTASMQAIAAAEAVAVAATTGATSGDKISRYAQLHL